MTVELDIEYCNKCGYLAKFEELSQHIKTNHPEVKVNGREGRRASFEVTINGDLVHSKLSTLAYPDYNDLSSIIKEVEAGKKARVCKQQPITSCCLS